MPAKCCVYYLESIGWESASKKCHTSTSYFSKLITNHCYGLTAQQPVLPSAADYGWKHYGDQLLPTF